MLLLILEYPSVGLTKVTSNPVFLFLIVKWEISLADTKHVDMDLKNSILNSFVVLARSALKGCVIAEEKFIDTCLKVIQTP